LLDTTSGAGAVGEKGWRKRYADFYFLTPPEQLIFTHLPEEPKWQLLEQPASAQDFVKWPGLDNYRLFAMGVNPADLRRQVQEKPERGVVYVTLLPGGPRLLLHKVPLEKRLAPGEYTFQVEVAGYRNFGLFGEGEWLPLKKNGPVFEGSVALRKKGEFML